MSCCFCFRAHATSCGSSRRYTPYSSSVNECILAWMNERDVSRMHDHFIQDAANNFKNGSPQSSASQSQPPIRHGRNLSSCPCIEKNCFLWYVDLWICDLVICDCLEVEEGWRWKEDGGCWILILWWKKFMCWNCIKHMGPFDWQNFGWIVVREKHYSYWKKKPDKLDMG